MNLGPLPKSDRNRELQELSFRALREALPVDLFVLRDERIEDAGVDASIELLAEKSFTNMRAQIQLKSTDSADLNSDGSFSLQVDSSNLNYLLNNATSGLYILYFVPRDELRFVWARDEHIRIERQNPDWMQQRTVTIRFEMPLTTEAIEPIYERIRQEAQLHRQIHESLGRASIAENVVILVDPETLAMQDAEQIFQTLEESGLTLVAAGYPDTVIEHIRQLGTEAARNPRIHLVNAYANYTLSNYLTCLGPLAQARLHRDQLTKDDQLFLESLNDANDYQLSRITREEYLRRKLTRIQEADDSSQIEFKLDELQHILLSETDPNRYTSQLSQFRNYVDAFSDIDSVHDSFKLQARLVLLRAQGRQAVMQSASRLFDAKIRTIMGLDADNQKIFDLERNQWTEWIQLAAQALETAQTLNHPLLLAEAWLTLVKVNTGHLMIGWLMADMSLSSASRSPEILKGLTSAAHTAISIYSRAGHLEGELRAQLTLAELLQFFDLRDQAKELANTVQPKAKAMNYVDLVTWAEKFALDKTMWDDLRSIYANLGNVDGDVVMARYSDNELDEMAVYTITLLEIPPTRQPIVRAELQSLQDIAHEALYWCRYIELRQDGRHTTSPVTMYREDPERFVRCALHDYQSQVRSTNWTAVITAFKQTRCVGCGDRMPKLDTID